MIVRHFMKFYHSLKADETSQFEETFGKDAMLFTGDASLPLTDLLPGW